MKDDSNRRLPPLPKWKESEFNKNYHMSVDPAFDKDHTVITKVERKRINLPEVKAEVSVSDHMYRRGNKDEKEHLIEQLKHNLLSKLVHELSEMEIVRIVNRTEEVLEKRSRHYNLTDEEGRILDRYHTQHEVVLGAELDVDGVENGYRVSEFNSTSKIDPESRLPLDEVDAEFLWKLLPPRINGIDEMKHPLQPGWMGTLPREKDKKIIKQVKRILNKQ